MKLIHTGTFQNTDIKEVESTQKPDSFLKAIKNNVIDLFKPGSQEDNIIQMDSKMLKDIGYERTDDKKEEFASNYYLY